jgi:hypothetical protein
LNCKQATETRFEAKKASMPVDANQTLFSELTEYEYRQAEMSDGL